MSIKTKPEEQDTIVVGRPLPFSVFGAEGQLLLAEGNVVSNDHTRYLLLRQGVYRDAIEGADLPGHGHGATAVGPDSDPLDALARDYGATSAARRFALSVTENEADEAHHSWVIGAHGQTIILTAPRRPDGSLVAVKPGEVWTCRAFQLTSAFRFRSVVLKVGFEPYPHVHIEAPQHVERRTVRGRPRAAVYLAATVETATAARGTIVDLSISGGRLATEEHVRLTRGQTVRVTTKVELIDSQFELSLKASVVGEFGTCDGRHPRVLFYGLRFEPLTEVESLVLHSFVSGQLALELNSLWHMLSSASPANAAI
jgi:hypothetical protein